MDFIIIMQIIILEQIIMESIYLILHRIHLIVIVNHLPHLNTIKIINQRKKLFYYNNLPINSINYKQN
jgi:hypothetical protein